MAAQVSESGLGNAFWFADDPYNLQYGQGANGDIAPDFKLNYGGLVFRDLEHGVNQYTIYASVDVYIPVGDEMSNRIMPPFQGAAGGPDGGPLTIYVHPATASELKAIWGRPCRVEAAIETIVQRARNEQGERLFNGIERGAIEKHWLPKYILQVAANINADMGSILDGGVVDTVGKL